MAARRISENSENGLGETAKYLTDFLNVCGNIKRKRNGVKENSAYGVAGG
jgi:hypothetical protein